MAKKVHKKLEELLKRFESQTLTAGDREALKVLLDGHVCLGEAVRSGDMKNAVNLVGEIFERAFPSS